MRAKTPTGLQCTPQTEGLHPCQPPLKSSSRYADSAASTHIILCMLKRPLTQGMSSGLSTEISTSLKCQVAALSVRQGCALRFRVSSVTKIQQPCAESGNRQFSPLQRFQVALMSAALSQRGILHVSLQLILEGSPPGIKRTVSRLSLAATWLPLSARPLLKEEEFQSELETLVSELCCSQRKTCSLINELLKSYWSSRNSAN